MKPHTPCQGKRFRSEPGEAETWQGIFEVTCDSTAVIINADAESAFVAPCGVHATLGIGPTATHGVPAIDRLLGRAGWAFEPLIGGPQR